MDIEVKKVQISRLANSVSTHCVGMEGNVSGKLDDIIFIKASGAKLSNLKPEDLVSFDFNGVQLGNFNRKGSMELSFHTFLLGFENINYVAHTHPTNTMKILCGLQSRAFANNRIFPDQVVFNGAKSCLVPYAKPGPELTEMIKQRVNTIIEEEKYFPKVILLVNHGIITCGETWGECTIATDICEKSAEIFSGIRDGIKYLTNEEVDALLADKMEQHRQQLLK